MHIQCILIHSIEEIICCKIDFFHHGSKSWAILYQNSPKKIPWSKFDQSFSKTLDLLESGSANVLCEISSCGRWSDIVAVITRNYVF